VTVGSALPIPASAMELHVHARSTPYPRGGPQRAPVADADVPWTSPLPHYAPPDYTASQVRRGPPRADPPSPAGLPFNTLDAAYRIDRRSASASAYAIDASSGRPLNPAGRTGCAGRGLLGRWGPNHAADPVVTRWVRQRRSSRSTQGACEDDQEVARGPDGRPLLEFVAILRRDGGGWALPGGKVEPGDSVSATLRKEFGEEALNALGVGKQRAAEIGAQIDALFASGGVELFRGYVDDPRNTDNAWMETTAVHFHDDGHAFDALALHAGDDAAAVRWTTITPDLQLYASHRQFVLAAAKRVGAFH
jgi:ADP-ribose pyrophosphatase